eukprot:6212685-Pleurochrysis_carterae.AAC.1
MGALGGHRRFCGQLSTAVAPRRWGYGWICLICTAKCRRRISMHRICDVWDIKTRANAMLLSRIYPVPIPYLSRIYTVSIPYLYRIYTVWEIGGGEHHGRSEGCGQGGESGWGVGVGAACEAGGGSAGRGSRSLLGVADPYSGRGGRRERKGKGGQGRRQGCEEGRVGGYRRRRAAEEEEVREIRWGSCGTCDA